MQSGTSPKDTEWTVSIKITNAGFFCSNSPNSRNAPYRRCAFLHTKWYLQGPFTTTLHLAGDELKIVHLGNEMYICKTDEKDIHVYMWSPRHITKLKMPRSMYNMLLV